MKNILRFGINSNMLKTIALIAMVIDHIGFYFEPFLNSTIMIACRYIGRIAMPIFTYLIVQGFFYTKDYKKYLLRLIIWACITQLVITGLMIINIMYIPTYNTDVYKIINVLFAYVISLIIIKFFHEDIIIKKWDYHKNLSLRIACIIILLLTSIIIPIDYGISIPILSILFYFIEKLKNIVMIKTEIIRTNIGKFLKIDDYKIIYIIYVSLLLIAIVFTCYTRIHIYSVFAIIPIALYNGERGKKSKILKYFYYFFFPLQHALLYWVAMLIMLT